MVLHSDCSIESMRRKTCPRGGGIYDLFYRLQNAARVQPQISHASETPKGVCKPSSHHPTVSSESTLPLFTSGNGCGHSKFSFTLLRTSAKGRPLGSFSEVAAFRRARRVQAICHSQAVSTTWHRCVRAQYSGRRPRQAWKCCRMVA